MLRVAMGTLLGHDVGACLGPPDPWHMGTFARLAPTRSAGLAAPTAGAATLPAAEGAAREPGPLALGRALAWVDRMASGARHRQAWNRHRLAPTRVPTVVDVEKPTPERAAGGP